jgi:DNA-binding LacI/PurR family transcriptional regulator
VKERRLLRKRTEPDPIGLSRNCRPNEIYPALDSGNSDGLNFINLTGSVEAEVPITINDVAAKAGVSKAAVSYVLNGRAAQAKIPSETAERILAVAREMQYRPNALARGLAGKRTGAIRVVLQYAQWFSVWSGFTSEMMRGLAAAAYQEDFELVLHTRRSTQQSLESELAQILDGRTDGAVLMRKFNDPLLPELAERGFPFVLMFSHAEEDRIATVDCDNVLGGRLATDYLLDLGHTRILHVAGGKEDSSPGARRRQGSNRAKNGLSRHGRGAMKPPLLRSSRRCACRPKNDRPPFSPGMTVSRSV